MMKRYPPVSPRVPHFLHGGDYNPDQWLDTPGIIEEDMRLMKLARCNAMSVGIFAWAALEPEEGKFTFDWLDRVMDLLAKNGACAVLATPSGARPAWMSHKYPEVLRVEIDRRRILHGQRHNHCYTSPIYREKCGIINRKLAERYRNHPALAVWHISNEYGGMCHCELCQQAFRQWLRGKYGTLKALNHAWWTAFWSHTYTDWSQIESSSPIGENCTHGLDLDWMRFVTHQTIDFYKSEISPLRELTPEVPITTNFMGHYEGLNYWEFAKEVDVVAWDNYPQWHASAAGDAALAQEISLIHDINRCLKGGRPFMLMESTPSMTNWQPVAKLKRPGVHLLSSLQAVAHGADTVQYFQWRKSRGSAEKFHGAVVDHAGHENTRVFRDVAELGEALGKLTPVLGTTVRPEVGLIMDWENRWAINLFHGANNRAKKYFDTCVDHYRPLWQMSIPVDVIDQTCELDSYKLVVAPMMYMLRPGVAERVERFVREGGTLVTTYLTGITDENDLVFLGGWPGPLRKVLGIWAEEIDALPETDYNLVAWTGRIGGQSSAERCSAMKGPYRATELCDLIHLEGAEALATYQRDFYAGRPAVTVNPYGKGKAYYVASRNDAAFHSDFFRSLSAEMGLSRVMKSDLPAGVTAQMRTDGKERFVFLMNFTPQPQAVHLGGETFADMLTGAKVTGNLSLPAYGSVVLRGAY